MLGDTATPLHGASIASFGKKQNSGHGWLRAVGAVGVRLQHRRAGRGRIKNTMHYVQRRACLRPMRPKQPRNGRSARVRFCGLFLEGHALCEALVVNAGLQSCAVACLEISWRLNVVIARGT